MGARRSARKPALSWPESLPLAAGQACPQLAGKPGCRPCGKIAVMDETALVVREPGYYLDRPQRLGIVPTMRFWNRPDVWQGARWLVLPAVAVEVAASVTVGQMVGGTLAPLAAAAWFGATLGLTLGTLERYIRRQLRARPGDVALHAIERQTRGD